MHPFPRTPRAGALWILGAMFVDVGIVGYVLNPPPPATAAYLKVPLSLVDSLEFWGWVMATVGAFAMVTSYSAARRWGFTVLSSYLGAWGSCYLAGLGFDSPLRVLSSVGLWWGLAAVTITIAAIVEAPDPRRIK